MTALYKNSNQKRNGKRPRSIYSASLVKSSVILSCYLTLSVHSTKWPSTTETQPSETNRSKSSRESPSFGTSQDENPQYNHHNVVRRREEHTNSIETQHISNESNLGKLENVDLLESLAPGEELAMVSDVLLMNVSFEIDAFLFGGDIVVSSSDVDQESSSISNTSENFGNTHQQRQHFLNIKRPVHDLFMSWCRDVLGIYAVVQIQFFEYVDFMDIDPSHNLEDDIETAGDDVETDRSVVNVRGLAAASDIEIGDVVIGIPLKALWSVATLIDSDPILGGDVMGPAARQKHGWNIAALDDDETSAQKIDLQFYEMPLLAVALLYHVQLGQTSSFAPYVDILKETQTDSLPFLWSAQRIRSSSIASEGLRTVARGIRREMKEMYQTVVKILIDQHPSIFGKHAAQSGQDWMFSYGKFQWAFAIINSRHWRLPIEDLEIIEKNDRRSTSHQSFVDIVSNTVVDEQIPPADMPTEHWIQGHEDLDEDFLHDRLDPQDPTTFFTAARHSFLAPVADLLNFGPPCTRGRYNKESQTFEIIATCSFRKGQEVTFWYSDECQHVVMGVYGFSHPLIPSCLTSEDLRLQNEVLEEELVSAFSELELIQHKLADAETALRDCECSRYNLETDSVSSLKDSTISGSSERGSSRKSMKHEGKPRIRRTYSRRSEF
jgi:SET domain